MKTITINVTQEHIDRGVRACEGKMAPVSENCMVALAMERALPLCTSMAFLDSCRIEDVRDNWTREWIYWPDGVESRIRLFDAGYAVKPFSFQLQVPDWAVAEEPVRNPVAAPMLVRTP